MDDLNSLMEEICALNADEITVADLESYCKRYLHYYHQHKERQPSRFYGAWGWSEARRREFRKAFESARIKR